MRSRKITIIILVCCALLSVIAAVAAVTNSLIIRRDKNKVVEVQPQVSSETAETTSEPTEEPTPTPTPTPEPTPTPTPEPTPEPTPTPKATQNIDVSGIDPNKPIVALTFDDGPAFKRSGADKSSTERILATLKEYNCHATFFVVGSMNVDLLAKEAAEGHEIGNHTMTHQSNFKKVSIDKVKEEIEDLEKVVRDRIGRGTFLVRPPWGAYTQEVLDKVDHPMILWSVDTLDWKTKDKDAIMKEVKNQVHDGAIILMHDIHATTADAVEIVVPWLIDHGYQIASVSEMFAARKVPLEAGHAYSKCTPKMMQEAADNR